jgi:hypothetical protein
MCRLIRITGFSLFPTYQGGDFVLISRLPVVLRRVKAGDVLVFHQVGYGTLIKRVERVFDGGESFYVAGTQAESVGSREFGAVLKGQVRGKVIYHIKNPDRLG